MVVALPESALTGYFLEGGVRDNAVTAGTLARDLDRVYRAVAFVAASRSTSTLGFYEIWNNKLYNSAMYVTLGDGDPHIRHVHRKVFLPTYGLFDEERFVERGRDVRAFDTSWGRAAMLVCEDAWHSLTATIAALDGAQIIFVCAAPPARGPWPKTDDVPGPGEHESLGSAHSRDRRRARRLRHADDARWQRGRQGLSWRIVRVGRATARYRGRAPLWEDAILSVSVDLADVTRARADMPLIADLETMLPHLRASIDDVDGGHTERRSSTTSRRSTRRKASSPRSAAMRADRSQGSVQVVRGPHVARDTAVAARRSTRRSPSSGSSISSARKWRGAEWNAAVIGDLGRRRFSGDGVSRGEGARTRERARRSNAVSNVEQGKSRPRAARDRRAGNSVANDRHQRRASTAI